MKKSRSNHSSAGEKDWKASLVENVISLGSALLVVFMIRSSLVEAFKIPSGSMIPTLDIGDHIFVNKFAYGLKVPFSDLVTNHPIFIVERDIPKHGDVIVFLYPKDEDIYYIKRVIGVPGDIVEMRNKVLYINHEEVKQTPYTPEKSHQVLGALGDPDYPEGRMKLFTEHLAGVDDMIMVDSGSYRSEYFGPITVPKDSLFVMGDNRDHSGDSRYWGFVPMKNVKGKAMFIWLSFWFDTFSFKPGRIGSLIQ